MEKRVAILEPNNHDTLPHPSAAPARVAGRFGCRRPHGEFFHAHLDGIERRSRRDREL